jgi:hypothetical protein
MLVRQTRDAVRLDIDSAHLTSHERHPPSMPQGPPQSAEPELAVGSALPVAHRNPSDRHVSAPGGTFRDWR